MDPEPDEAELARRAREGDREALAELVERARLPLFALAYAELRHYEDAQDAVASALLQICRHVGELREPERARQWMHRITRNEARLILRRRAITPISLDAEEGSLEAGLWEMASVTDADSTVLRLDIERALRQLPREEARAVALFYLARLSIREIAARLGRPEGTIKRWLHLGRQHLASEMEGYAPMKRRQLIAGALAAAAVLGSAPTAAPADAAKGAPRMTPPTNATTAKAAAIISTDLDPAVLQSLVEAMKTAGWEDVATLGAVPPLEERIAADGAREFHLAAPLNGRQFIVLDEWIGGRSAFELHILLKAAAEAKEMGFGLFLAAPAEDNTVFAAWAAGFELLLTKPIDPAEFGRFSQRILNPPKP
jgi:RNA polymerase sigma-70 factor (ECF subfamily)